MRLVDTRTLKLKEFDALVPRYAVLSHRWEKEEVSFQDLSSGNGPNKHGYAKVVNCCQQALSDGLIYVVSNFFLFHQKIRGFVGMSPISRLSAFL
jgi:hypothetical protein